MAAVRQHQSIRAVARRFGVSTSTVVYWVERAKGQRLDRVDCDDRSRAPHHTQRTEAELEERCCAARQIRQDSDQGYGADAIHQALRQQGLARPFSTHDPPHPATTQGSGPAAGFGDRHRLGVGICPTWPRAGWSWTVLTSSGLVIKAGPGRVLNGVSLHGGLPVSWPRGAR